MVGAADIVCSLLLCSVAQVGQCGHHLGAGCCLKGWVDHRCEERRVVGRDIGGDGSRGHRILVFLRIHAAHRPVGIGNAEGIRNGAEVLRGGGRVCMVDLSLGEMGFESRGDLGVGRLVIAGERELVVELELRFLGRAGSLAFAAHNPVGWNR